MEELQCCVLQLSYTVPLKSKLAVAWRFPRNARFASRENYRCENVWHKLIFMIRCVKRSISSSHHLRVKEACFIPLVNKSEPAHANMLDIHTVHILKYWNWKQQQKKLQFKEHIAFVRTGLSNLPVCKQMEDTPYLSFETTTSGLCQTESCFWPNRPSFERYKKYSSLSSENLTCSICGLAFPSSQLVPSIGNFPIRDYMPLVA